jgi:hypothetical protein
VLKAKTSISVKNVALSASSLVFATPQIYLTAAATEAYQVAWFVVG